MGLAKLQQHSGGLAQLQQHSGACLQRPTKFTKSLQPVTTRRSEPVAFQVQKIFAKASQTTPAPSLYLNTDPTTYRGADKTLARPGRKQAREHVRDARDFNNMETRAVIKFFFSCKARRQRKFTPF